MAYAEDAERQVLHEPKSYWTKYVWSQDHKVIAIQYSLTAITVGLIALVLSGLMRMQLGFPGVLDINASEYYQYMTMHGMIMVIYLLTALFLGGFGNYLIPLMVGARDMVFPYVNMLSYWVYLLSVLILISSFFVPGGPTGAGWTLYPPPSHIGGYTRNGMGHYSDAGITDILYCCGYHGWSQLCHHRTASSYPWYDIDAYASLGLGYFYRYHFGITGFPCVICQRRNDVAG